MIAVAHTAAIAAAIVVFVLCANVIFVQYGRGVVRGALDTGVRAGSGVASGAAACERRAEQALNQLLDGPMGDGVTIRCHETPDRVLATADVVFPSWLPPVPDVTFTAQAAAVNEQPTHRR